MDNGNAVIDNPDALKRESVRQWSNEPAGAHLASHETPRTVAFYDEVERTRYDLYPWLRPYVCDPRWSGERVLEIGVGLGTDHMMLRRSGAIMTGVDITPASIANTRQRFDLAGEQTQLVEADCEDLPFTDGEFDAVWSFGVLHHTPGFQKAIDEACRVVRPGGRLVVGLYNRYSYFHAWRLLRHAARGQWRGKSLAEMRAEFEFGEGTPVVRLSSRRELVKAFDACSHVDIVGKHLPTNRLPAHIRRQADALLGPLEQRIGWYWMVTASR